MNLSKDHSRARTRKRAVCGNLFPARLILLATALLLAPPPARSASPGARTLEFRGQVVIPPRAVLRTRRISLTLLRVGTPFSARALADIRGRFRFRKVPPGTYSLSINVPGAGEFQSTLDVTASFADSKGRIEKTYSYDEETLAHKAQPRAQGLVSVRELSIPWPARREYEKARNDLRHEKVQNARQHFLKAVEIAPQYIEALNNLGIIAFQERDFDAAERYFRRALEKDPDAFEPLVNLGGTLLAKGRAEAAVEVNSRAQGARPADPLANAQLGMSYYLAGNDEEALNYLLLTEQLDPAHYTNPQIPLARIYLSHSNEQAAVEELTDFLDRHPDSPEAGSVRAMIEKINQAPSSDRAATAAF